MGMTGANDLAYASSANDVSMSWHVIEDILIKFGDSGCVKSQILIKIRGLRMCEESRLSLTLGSDAYSPFLQFGGPHSCIYCN